MKAKKVNQVLNESVSYLTGYTFEHPKTGLSYTITNVVDAGQREIIHTEEGPTFFKDMLEEMGVQFPDVGEWKAPRQKRTVQRKPRKPVQREPLMSKPEYQRTLRDSAPTEEMAMELGSDIDVGDMTYDIAENLYYQEDLRNRVIKDNPELISKQDIIFQIKSDLENYL